MLAGRVDLDELDRWVRIGWERNRGATEPYAQLANSSMVRVGRGVHSRSYAATAPSRPALPEATVEPPSAATNTARTSQRPTILLCQY
jgi:hypothetical protein